MISSILLSSSGRKIFLELARDPALHLLVGETFLATAEAEDLVLLMVWAPTLEVMMRTTFLKSTVRPCASVSCPSSSIWRSILKTSGWAFSISSKRTTLYGGA